MMTAMLHVPKIVVLLLALLWSVASTHAQTVDGRILLEADGGDGLRARVQLRADQPLHVGTSTLLLRYDPSVIAVPSGAAANTFLDESDYTSQLPEPAISGTYGLTASLFGPPGTLALNLDVQVPTFGVRIDTVWTALAEVRFVHVDRTVPPTLSWIPATAPEPSVLLADDNATLLALGTLAAGTLPAATADEPTEQPGVFGLSALYPNPFAQSTTVVYTLATPGRVTLEVFDILGRRMSQLVADDHTAGTYMLEWDGSDLASGIYLMRLAHGDRQATRMVIRAR